MTSVKKWLVISASLVVLGAMIVALAACSAGWSFGFSKMVTNTHELTDDFSDIFIDTFTADVELLPSTDGKCKVVCYEREDLLHSVSVQDGTLKIELKDDREWYEIIEFTGKSPDISIYLPKSEYASLVIDDSTGDIAIPADFSFTTVNVEVTTGDVNYAASASGDVRIESTTGDVELTDISAASLSVELTTGRVKALGISCSGDVTVNVTTGDVELADVQCKSLMSEGNTGYVTVKCVTATDRISLERTTGDVTFDDSLAKTIRATTDTGDVRFDGSDAEELYMETDTGSVKGSLLSEKVFITKTDTGSVSVPDSVSGGRCEITTDTGSIKVTIK